MFSGSWSSGTSTSSFSQRTADTPCKTSAVSSEGSLPLTHSVCSEGSAATSKLAVLVRARRSAVQHRVQSMLEQIEQEARTKQIFRSRRSERNESVAQRTRSEAETPLQARRTALPRREFTMVDFRNFADVGETIYQRMISQPAEKEGDLSRRRGTSPLRTR